MSFYGNTVFYLEVKKGNVVGHTIVDVTGTNTDVDTGTPEDIWPPGGNLVYPTANETVELFSADANDTAAGTGAQEVTITYMDDNHIVQTPVAVSTNGGTVATGITDYFRLVGMDVTAAGSSGFNAGDITLRVSGGSATRTAINFNTDYDVGVNTALDSHFTVPAGKTGYIITVSTSSRKGKDAVISLGFTNGTNNLFANKFPIATYQNSFVVTLDAPLGPFPEKTDIKAICATENVNTEVQISYQVLLVDN